MQRNALVSCVSKHAKETSVNQCIVEFNAIVRHTSAHVFETLQTTVLGGGTLFHFKC